MFKLSRWILQTDRMNEWENTRLCGPLMLGNLRHSCRRSRWERRRRRDKLSPAFEAILSFLVISPALMRNAPHIRVLASSSKFIQGSSPHSEAKCVLDELKSHEHPKFGNEFKIAVLGDSDVGESSSTNSVLEIGNLTARASFFGVVIAKHRCRQYRQLAPLDIFTNSSL